jgi:hypothetical protein
VGGPGSASSAKCGDCRLLALLKQAREANGYHPTFPLYPIFALRSRVPLEALQGAIIGKPATPAPVLLPKHAALVAGHAPYLVRGCLRVFCVGLCFEKETCWTYMLYML